MTSWPESYFQENWNVIWNIQPIVNNVGMLYRIDLLNEGAPPASSSGPSTPYHPTWSEYARKLWINYNLRFPKSTTLGFSIPVDSNINYRVQHFGFVYGGNLPYLYDLHFYGDVLTNFTVADYSFDLAGISTPGWIIGESFYNDNEAASDIAYGIP